MANYPKTPLFQPPSLVSNAPQRQRVSVGNSGNPLACEEDDNDDDENLIILSAGATQPTVLKVTKSQDTTINFTDAVMMMEFLLLTPLLHFILKLERCHDKYGSTMLRGGCFF
jgi:hypothetical protein